MMKDFLEAMLGVKIDPDAEVSTPEKMKAYIEQKVAAEAETRQAEKAKRDARKAAKPQTEKQKQAEEKRAAKALQEEEEAKKITKSVREVYMDLVKAFHPDLEQDEVEKARKTAILQRVTLAYEANDLLELLNLQMELERIDQQHIETMPDDRLKMFNKVLREQVKELQDQLQAIEMELAYNMNPQSMAYAYSIEQARFALKKDIKFMKENIKGLKQDLAQINSPKDLKNWLKDFKIPKRGGLDAFFDNFFD